MQSYHGHQAGVNGLQCIVCLRWDFFTGNIHNVQAEGRAIEVEQSIGEIAICGGCLCTLTGKPQVAFPGRSTAQRRQTRRLINARAARA